MEIELLTKKDLATLTDILILMHAEIKEMREIIGKKEDKLLGSKDIIKRLGISYSTFMKHRSEMAKFGLYSDGKIKMKTSDFEKYFESLRNGY